MTDLAAGATEQSAAVGTAVEMRTHILTPEQKEGLSKALFPDTHLGEAKVAGKKRDLKPLTIKTAKQISTLLESFQGLVAQAEESKKPVELDLLPLVMKACDILATHYGWEDLAAAIEEEDVSLTELQHLLVQQVRLQDMNDFLLNGLRVLVGTMQIAEIEATRLQSIYNGLL